MSIFCDFDVGKTGRRFRRAVDSDKYDIQQFWKREHTDALFGEADIGSLIELSVLAICLINEEKEVTGFMALYDCPKVPGTDPAEWEIWMRNMYHKYYLARNTLFIQFMCCQDEVVSIFFEEALLSVFMNDVYLKNIVLMVPPKCPPALISRYKNFYHYPLHKYCPRKDEDFTDHCPNFMYVALRQEFCPKLKVRRAVEEDNDDLFEILDKKCPKLKELYGEYYISETIGHHPDSGRHVMVAEHKERAVGIMCLNSYVNYKMLQDTYDLYPYHGLIKTTPMEKEMEKRRNSLLTTFGDPIMTGQLSPFFDFRTLNTFGVEDHYSMPHHNLFHQKKDSKGYVSVNFGENAMRMSFDHLFFRQGASDDYSKDSIELDINSDPPSRHSSIDELLLDGDPFDYEIINIDKKLLHFITQSISIDYTHRPSVVSATFENESSMEIPDIPKWKRRRSSTRPLLIQKVQDSSNYIFGESNAFTIELYGLRDDLDERQAYDLLEVAFEVMSDREYCIILVPCSEKNIPLLQHFCFIPTRNHVCSEYSLYIAHRSSVLGKLRVRRAEIADIPQIATLLNNLDGKETILTVETSFKTSEHQAYVFLSGMTIIGLGILEKPEHIDFIRTRFNLDSFHIHKYHFVGHGQLAGFATLKSAIVYPVFEPHFRFFARDMMRQSASDSLIWLTPYRNKWVANKANSLVASMVPILPRKSNIDCVSVPELKRFTTMSKEIMAFSTWYLNRKMSSILKMNVDTRIVVVGASRAALGFLDPLLFSDVSSYLTFTNVTLVSLNGLPYVRNSKKSASLMFSKHRTNSDKYLKSVPYTYYVNVVQGKMVDINKQMKYITLQNATRYYYDMLFLFLGKQYQHPDYLKVVFDREKEVKLGNAPSYIRLDIPRASKTEFQLYNFNVPENVFLVNDFAAANKAFVFLKNITWLETDYKILVYGDTIDTYCCLTALLDAEMIPENIVFVEPFPPENPNKGRVPVFCNQFVDFKVRATLKKLNIKMYSSCFFQSWIVNKDNNRVTHVDFLCNFELVKMECTAFFYYGKRGVDVNAFVAINKSGMAYDGGILIDHDCKTKDSSIYAAGPVTRYHRKYYGDNKRQKYYDSYEVGEKLGEKIRNQLDPLFLSKKKPAYIPPKKKSVSFDASSFNSDRKMLEESCELPPEDRLPVFTNPIVYQCTLPGNLQYLEVRSPGKKVPHHFLQSLKFNGYVLETYKQGYFKLHLTEDLVVDGITCLTTENYNLDNFKNLYGLSAVILNNVHLRFGGKMIDNFYKFFTLPWAFYLYYDHRDELFASVKELLPDSSNKGKRLKDYLRIIANSHSDVSYKSLSILELGAKSDKSPHVEAITSYVIDWLSDNENLLPMYLQPSQKTYYDYDHDKNPCFKKRKRFLHRMLSYGRAMSN